MGNGGDTPGTQPEELHEALEEHERTREEPAKTSEEARARKASSRRRWRKVGAGFLVFLTALLVLVSTVAVWTKATLFQTPRFVSLVEPALTDPTVTNAMANRLTDQLFQALDLQGRIENVTSSLPPPLDQALQRLIAPIVSSTQGYVRGKVQQEFRSAGFHTLLVQIVTVAHERAIALIEKNYAALPNVVVQDGQIKLNLLPIASRVIRSIVVDAASLFGIPASAIPTISPGDDPGPAIQRLTQVLGIQLPADFGQITVLTTAQLEPVQTAAERFQRLVVLIVLLALVLLILAIVVSVNRRRTVVQLGIAVAAGLLVAAIAIRKIKDSVVDGLSSPAGRGAAREVFDSMIGSLRVLILWVVAIALLAALIAYLLGRPSWLMKAIAWGRREGAARPGGSSLARWTAAHADALRIAGIVVAILLLLVIGFGWISFLVIAALLALYIWGVEALRRQGAPLDDAVPPGGAGPGTDTAPITVSVGTGKGADADTTPTEEIQTADG
jgi:hypothetical protein